MKKRKIVFALAIATGLLFSGCGKASPEAQAVIDKIESIGEVSFEDEDLVNQIETEYLSLTEEQQQEVKNFKKLASARDEIDNLYVKAVVEQIESIGTVEIDDEELIGEIEENYYKLSESQREKVNNIGVLSSAREELDKLIAAKPIPFSDANWETTQSGLVELLGKPADEYDNESYGHILLYEGIKNEGYTGEAKYCFENGKLTRVFFTVDRYDEELIQYFQDLFETKYGEPTYSDDYGNKRWDTEYVSCGTMGVKLFGGLVNILYMSPNLGGNQ